MYCFLGDICTARTGFSSGYRTVLVLVLVFVKRQYGSMAQAADGRCGGSSFMASISSIVCSIYPLLSRHHHIDGMTAPVFVHHVYVIGDRMAMSSTVMWCSWSVGPPPLSLSDQVFAPRLHAGRTRVQGSSSTIESAGTGGIDGGVEALVLTRS